MKNLLALLVLVSAPLYADAVFGNADFGFDPAGPVVSASNTMSVSFEVPTLATLDYIDLGVAMMSSSALPLSVDLIRGPLATGSCFDSWDGLRFPSQANGRFFLGSTRSTTCRSADLTMHPEDQFWLVLRTADTAPNWQWIRNVDGGLSFAMHMTAVPDTLPIPPPSTTPEPSSWLSFAAIGAIVLYRRMRTLPEVRI